jgi:hypothetical protein
MNPIDDRRDERSGRQTEGTMIIEVLLTAFIVTFIAIAILGHVLVLQAAFTPAPGHVRGKKPTARRHITRQSPVRGSRRRVGSASRVAGSRAVPAFTRSSS